MHAVDTSAVRADFYECRTYSYRVLFCVVCDSGLLGFDGIYVPLLVGQYVSVGHHTSHRTGSLNYRTLFHVQRINLIPENCVQCYIFVKFKQRVRVSRKHARHGLEKSGAERYC